MTDIGRRKIGAILQDLRDGYKPKWIIKHRGVTFTQLQDIIRDRRPLKDSTPRKKTMKVKLRNRKENDIHGGLKTVPWNKAEPFFVNPRAILIHRVKGGGSFTRNGVVSHHFVTFWCGNSKGFDDVSTVTDNPPADRLLCSFCEAKAVAAGERTADELAGRHIHIGILRAKRRCCLNDEN